MLTAQINNKLMINKVKFLGLHISNKTYYNLCIIIHKIIVYYTLLFQSQISYFQYWPNNVYVNVSSDEVIKKLI